MAIASPGALRVAQAAHGHLTGAMLPVLLAHQPPDQPPDLWGTLPLPHHPTVTCVNLPPPPGLGTPHLRPLPPHGAGARTPACPAVVPWVPGFFLGMAGQLQESCWPAPKAEAGASTPCQGAANCGSHRTLQRVKGRQARQGVWAAVPTVGQSSQAGAGPRAPGEGTAF